MFNILVIGAGQIGSRHLQALKKTEFPIFIEVVDPIEEAWATCKLRLSEIPENPFLEGISFHKNINQTKSEIDLCIISTNSDVRFDITTELISQKKIKNILFEKVLFQSISEYEIISKLLNDNKIEAWVNCSKRMFQSYRFIKEKLVDEKNISIMVDGNQWGLACNSIHFIDLITFLTGDKTIVESQNILKKILVPSKRTGHFEVIGSLRFRFLNDSELLLRSGSGNQYSLVINIHSENFHFCIDEDRNFISMSTSLNNWNWEQLTLNQNYQSNLTQKIAKDILIGHDCILPSFELSKSHHVELLKTILPTFKEVLGDQVLKISIT